MAQELIGNTGVYAILQQIGSGSYGSVHLLQDIKTQKYFACKMVSKQKMRQYQTEDMVRQEIQIQSSLHHKNILKLIEWFEDSSYIFIVLEYCSRGTLNIDTTNDGDLFNVVYQLMCGIDYLHSNKIVHRDLKPENILMSEDGTLKICDFGWACHIIDRLPVVSICGTTQYMPPEVVSKQYHDFRLDIWSLGVIIYFILHKVEPFEGASQQELIYKILHKDVIVNQSIDEDLSILVQAMLTKQLDFRPTIQQLFISKWMKRQMRAQNIYNKYENEELKNRLRQKQTQIKSIGEYSQPQNRVLAHKMNSLQLSASSSQNTNSTNPCSPMYQSRMDIFTFREQEAYNNVSLPNHLQYQ